MKLAKSLQQSLRMIANNSVAAALTKDYQASQAGNGEWIAEEWLDDIDDIDEFDGGGFWFVPDKH